MMTSDMLKKRKRLSLDSSRGDSFFLDHDSDSDSDSKISPIKKIVLFSDSEQDDEDVEEYLEVDKGEIESIASIEDDNVETTLRGREIIVRPTLTNEEKQKELKSIENFGGDYWFMNQVIACTLWDIDFRFTLLSHQYEGVLAVAGLDMNTVSNQLASLSNGEKLQAIDLENSGRLFRRTLFMEFSFVETKGMFLADEMVSFLVFISFCKCTHSLTYFQMYVP